MKHVTNGFFSFPHESYRPQIWEATNETVPMVEVTSWFSGSGKFSADLEENFLSVQ